MTTQAHGKSPSFSLLLPQPLAQYFLPARAYHILHTYCYHGHWSKLDLSNGFWRMVVQGGLEPNFLYVLPIRTPSDPVHVVLPGSLQMGWTNSPPYFCEVTDIIVTLILRLMAASYATNGIHEPHPLEHHACRAPSLGRPPRALSSKCLLTTS